MNHSSSISPSPSARLRVLFTGASSFSGYWFCKTLAEAGHEVTATFTRDSVEAYPEAGFAQARVKMVQEFVRPVWGARMGNDVFFAALENDGWDLVCLHGAYVANHKAADFPELEAVAANTAGIQRMVEYLANNGKTPILWTGTYFEAGEGQGTEPLRNFSPYALSKQLSWEYARFYAEQAGLPISKFVMPNPFGPWEGKGFTSYLARTWLRGNVASVKTPDYIRDNCPVDLLALAYADFVRQIATNKQSDCLSPGAYQETQGMFAERFSRELSSRWERSCPLNALEQQDFPEPLHRTNKTEIGTTQNSWDESAFWDQAAGWFAEQLLDR